MFWMVFVKSFVLVVRRLALLGFVRPRLNWLIPLIGSYILSRNLETYRQSVSHNMAPFLPFRISKGTFPTFGRFRIYGSSAVWNEGSANILPTFLPELGQDLQPIVLSEFRKVLFIPLSLLKIFGLVSLMFLSSINSANHGVFIIDSLNS